MAKKLTKGKRVNLLGIVRNIQQSVGTYFAIDADGFPTYVATKARQDHIREMRKALNHQRVW